MCAEICSLVRSFEELKGSATECVDQNCGFCKEMNKTSSVDVTPKLGVNHVISCVVVFVVVIFFYGLINIYLIINITAKY